MCFIHQNTFILDFILTAALKAILTMGWTYNTVNPDAETNAPTITAVGVAFTTVSLIIVVLRMFVRVFMIKTVGTGM